MLVKTTGFLHTVTKQDCPTELKSHFSAAPPLHHFPAMSGKAAVLDRQLLCEATNTSWKRVLCMFPFWLFWASHGGTDDTFPCILFMPFLSVAPESPQSIQQYFPDAGSVVSSNLAGKFSFYPGPTTVLSLPHITEQNFFSITDCLSEQPIHTWSLG